MQNKSAKSSNSKSSTSGQSNQPGTKTSGHQSKKTASPSVKSNPNNQKEKFIKNLESVEKQYDWSDENKEASLKAERSKALQELQEFIADPKNVSQYIIPHLERVMEVIQKNIFRALPITKVGTEKIGEEGISEENLIIDPAWPHLQGVYEFFLQLIVSEAADVKSLKVFVTPSFIQEFLQLFDSQETRERDCLKNILHRLYAKLVPRRKMIRKAINDCFFNLIHETGRFNGASELLDILASIISGFAVPLREEHVIFFRTVIIPLHKVQTSHFYHEQLLRCSMLFLSKDHSLAIPLVEGLLRYWPFANSPKETMFLSELQEVLEVCELPKLEQYIPQLFQRLVKCISGPHLQVADRAMCFFENDYFLGILRTYKTMTFPMVVPVICELADTHWHKILQESLNALKTILREIDSKEFEKALQSGPKDVSKLNSLNCMYKMPQYQKSAERWNTFFKQIQKQDPNFSLPVVPYADSHVVGLNNMNGMELSSANLIPPI